MTPRQNSTPETESVERIEDVDVATEMQGSFLEYAYSVIYSRALPDARDGLKPVQRRILYQMSEMGLRPDRGHVKSARVVGEVMGKLHPHGDTAIYDALVRMAQAFTLRVPLIDGHGNFGSLDDGPAAARYTEARLAATALAMTDGLDEDVVDFVPNYDNQLTQPDVLPAAYPNLLVNGASGIAVGMATNMAPHNLIEVVGAARHLLAHPDATLDDLMEFVPGPDLPTGGTIVGLAGIEDAYATGRGSFKTRAKVRVESITARKTGLIITELPYLVGPEKVIEKIKDGVNAKKISGISDVTDLTDRTNGLRLVIGIKTGFSPDAVLEQLYRLHPARGLLQHQRRRPRRRRTAHPRPARAAASSTSTTACWWSPAARATGSTAVGNACTSSRACSSRSSTSTRSSRSSARATTPSRPAPASWTSSTSRMLQAEYILELRLRRLTKFSRIELEAERDKLRAEIAELETLLASDASIRSLVSDELAEIAERFGTPRRTLLTEAKPSIAGAAAKRAAAILEVADAPCRVYLSATGRIARVDLVARDEDAPAAPVRQRRRSKHDAILLDARHHEPHRDRRRHQPRSPDPLLPRRPARAARDLGAARRRREGRRLPGAQRPRREGAGARLADQRAAPSPSAPSRASSSGSPPAPTPAARTSRSSP